MLFLIENCNNYILDKILLKRQSTTQKQKNFESHIVKWFLIDNFAFRAHITFRNKMDF